MDKNKVSKGLTAAAADGKKLFISVLKSEFRKSPLASNVLLGLILTGLEKAVEVEFACPCDPRWNDVFASAYFIVPGVTASVLMLVIQGCKCKVRQEKENLPFFGLVPAMMWLILVLLNGQYYVCAKTNWTGRFVIIDKANPQRWCEPTNGTLFMERMIQTQQWYFHSQAIGLGIILGCAILLILFGAYKHLSKKTTDGKTQDEEGPGTGEAVELTASCQDSCND